MIELLRPIGDVASIQGGYPFKSEDWQESGVPVVKIANVKDGHLDLAGCSFVSPAVANVARDARLAAGDILIGMTGSVGCVAKVGSADLPALMNQRVGRFRFRLSAAIEPAYFYRVVRLPEVRQQFESLAGGSAQPNLSGGQIESVDIPVPPLPDQRRLAGLLAALDDSKALQRARIAVMDRLGETALRCFLASLADVG
jgi:type I restriction enzyme S subunit